MTLCDHIQKQIVDYFADNLQKAETEKIKNHLNSCKACRKEYESFETMWNKMNSLPKEQPSQDLSVKFYTMLAAYQQGVQESFHKISFFDWLRGAFSRPKFQLGFSTIVLIVGFALGFTIRTGTEKISYSKLENELDDMRELVMISMLKQQSSVERLQAVNYSYQVEQPRADVRDALLRTFETDPSTNVRLAALRALQPYTHDSSVRRQIIDSFPKQQSPLVQVEIVDFIRLTESRPAEILNILEQNKNLNDVVRQHIKWTSGDIQNTPLLKEIKK